jgi:DNA polymerase III sliding clamp (beta) subunit (PCNA family)
MKVKTKALREAVEYAARMIRSTPNQMANFVKLEPHPEGLSITSTNLDEFLVQIIGVADAVEMIKPCLVQPRYLMASLYLASDTVEISQAETELVIKSAATVKVKTADADEFPALPVQSGVKKEINCADLAEGIRAVHFCAHKESSRAELCSIHFQSDSGTMVVEAADGANGAFYQFPWNGELKFLASAEHAIRLAEAFSVEGAELFLSDSLASVKHKLGSYSCKLSACKFPDTSSLRKGESFSASKPLGEINAEAITETLSAALMLVDSNQLPAMTVELSPKAIEFKSDSFQRKLDGKFVKHSTSVNAQALKKCIGAFGTQAVKIGTGTIDFLRLEAGKLSVITMSLREK